MAQGNFLFRTVLLSAVSLGLMGATAHAQSAADFYKAKRVKLTVSSGAGGGHDGFARLLARHMYRYIPNKPRIIVQNMPGGGGVRAANHMYNRAPQDGSMFGMAIRNIPFEPLYGNKRVKYDPMKFTYIGVLSNSYPGIVVWHTAKVKNIKDLLTKQLIVGTVPSSPQVRFNTALVNLLGYKIKVIQGYGNNAEIALAMERGEVEGIGSQTWDQLGRYNSKWIPNKTVHMLLTWTNERHPDLPNVPFARNLAKNKLDRDALEFILAVQEIAWPFLAPPNIPADRAKALRDAFEATGKDAKFVEEGRKQLLYITKPLNHVEMLKVIKRIYAQPKKVVDRALWAMNTQVGIVEDVKLKRFSGKVVGIKGRGRRISLVVDTGGGKTVTAKVHTFRVRIKVNGKRGRHSQLSKGMECKVGWNGPGTYAMRVNCTGKVIPKKGGRGRRGGGRPGGGGRGGAH